MSGGSSDTELKLLAVTPTFRPSALAVMTVTPVAKLPSARRNFRGSITASATGTGWPPAPARRAAPAACPLL
jgi:hypothetical protein